MSPAAIIADIQALEGQLLGLICEPSHADSVILPPKAQARLQTFHERITQMAMGCLALLKSARKMARGRTVLAENQRTHLDLWPLGDLLSAWCALEPTIEAIQQEREQRALAIKDPGLAKRVGEEHQTVEDYQRLTSALIRALATKLDDVNTYARTLEQAAKVDALNQARADGKLTINEYVNNLTANHRHA